MCMGGADYSSSIDAVIQGQASAIAALQNMFGKAEGYLKPYIETGQEAMGQLKNIFLGEGQDLSNIPAFQTLVNTLSKYGLKGLDRSAAARGLALSGPQMKGLTNWMQDMALTKSVQPYLSGVGGLYSGGLQGGSSLGNLAGSMGNSMANVYTGTGNTIAQLEAAQAQSSGSGLNQLMSGLGFGASLLAAPFTGGTSLLGALGGGLNSLFGSSTSAFSPSLLGTSNAYSPSSYSFNSSPSFASMYKRRGGPVSKRRMYIVGEEGPEIFVPSIDGVILPNEEYNSFKKASNW